MVDYTKSEFYIVELWASGLSSFLSHFFSLVVHYTHIATHAMSCCYWWLHPCVPCYPLHKYQYVPCLVAIGDCTYVYHVIHYTNISMYHVLLLLVTAPMCTMLSTLQISVCIMSCCYWWLHPCVPCYSLYKYQYVPCLVAIGDCTHVYHVIHYTNISMYHVLLLLVTAPMCTMLSTTQILVCTMSCCCYWLHPCMTW